MENKLVILCRMVHNWIKIYHIVKFLKRNLCLNVKGVCSMGTDKVLQSFS